ncbi:MAG: nitrate reductase molybdenum cofactor assembly chaperone [Acidimicrobiales bacterium]|jgi:nitrate reductase delta subunit
MTSLGPLKIRISAPHPEQRRVSFAVASALLRYPDGALLDDLGLFVSTTDQLPSALRQPFVHLSEHLSSRPLLDSQALYVATFDLKRRCCLYLSYYLNGDTRRRGLALWRLQEAYRRAGFRVAQGELPDFLPALLELAATGGESQAVELMQEHRAGIRLLLAALDELGSPYAGVVQTVDSLLPGSAPGVIANAVRLAHDGPPSELVGIETHEAFEPYGKHESCGGFVPGEASGLGLARCEGQEAL